MSKVRGESESIPSWLSSHLDVLSGTVYLMACVRHVAEIVYIFKDACWRHINPCCTFIKSSVCKTRGPEARIFGYLTPCVWFQPTVKTQQKRNIDYWRGHATGHMFEKDEEEKELFCPGWKFIILLSASSVLPHQCIHKNRCTILLFEWSTGKESSHKQHESEHEAFKCDIYLSRALCSVSWRSCNYLKYLRYINTLLMECVNCAGALYCITHAAKKKNRRQ